MSSRKHMETIKKRITPQDEAGSFMPAAVYSDVLKKRKREKKKKKSRMNNKQTGKMAKVCILGSTGSNGMDWYLFDISLDSLTKQGRRRIKLQQKQHKSYYGQVTSSFHHQYLHHCHHRHLSLNKDPNQLKREGLVIYPILSLGEKPLSNCQPIPFWGNSFASLGSTIFSIGGSTNYDSFSGSQLVHYMDTRHPYRGWKQAPSMITARFKPQVVALNNKLYVFGCSGIYKCKHDSSTCGNVWAEIFEPCSEVDFDGDSVIISGQWKALPDPPSQLFEAKRFVVMTPQNDELEEGYIKCSKKETIMVYITNYNQKYHDLAFEFNVKVGIWKFFKCKSEWQYDERLMDPPILVNGVLYWVDDNINAYDTSTGYTYAGPVQDLIFHRKMRKVFGVEWDERCSEPPPRPSFIHLGGRYFCMLSFVSGDSFHCLVIKVSRTQKLYHSSMHCDAFFLNVSVVSCQSYPVDRYCLLLDGRMLL